MKNAIIIGDSYSTFENYVPEGNKCYYIEAGRPGMDVTKVTQTWWHQVFAQTDLNLVLNESWAGTTVGYTGYDNEDCSQTNSFIYRLDRLVSSGFFAQNHIDTVFVFGGTNDHWAKAPLGTLKFENHTKEDLYFVLPAMCYLLKTLRALLPRADIYCVINTNLNPDMVAGFEEACREHCVNKVLLENIEKFNGHPTIKGMEAIKTQVLKVINSSKRSAE